MTTTFVDTTVRENSVVRDKSAVRAKPSEVDPATSKPFTLEQELKPFGTWVDAPVWVPPKDSNKEMAESMLQQSGLPTSKSKRWASVEREHRDRFTQVREIELAKASIRLPKGRLFVSVTERQHFDRITDAIPDCVQTRLDEFLAGPGRRTGVKVYYLKPLCVEVGDDLVFTSREDVMTAIETIQQEVFTEYRRLYIPRRGKQFIRQAAHTSLALPREIAKFVMQRRKKIVDAYHAKLEFQRRKTALRALRAHQKCRSHGCTFDEMLALTNPLERDDVIGQYAIEKELSRAKQDQLLRMAAGQLPWFVALSMGLSYLSALSTITLTFAPPIMVCDPAFVAEFPGSGGVLMNIGHFDEIGGVRHVEF
ncbi:hypothetical protein CA13_39810 [Planctomycetes bacterium CA13]|uniref:Uncharacterized protein n=1 Tax=Novipirellula herctigrandis TaxID=2527986 RepID=A0A5C5Z5C7_9BACT|nr:hypothetical protein CA13_39810 [Planctomycetes bacterium CA13]